MSQLFTIHPDNPQSRLIKQAVEILKSGGVIAYPTDSSYALGCIMGNKNSLERIREIRRIDENHHMTIMCRDLSELSNYAKVDNSQYRILKNNTPGAYTFILNATSEVPRRMMHPKKRTVGLRIPQNAITLALLDELNEPLLTTTLILPGEDIPMMDVWEIRDTLQHQLDLVIDGGYCGIDETTVIDLTDEVPVVIRAGVGDVSPFE